MTEPETLAGKLAVDLRIFQHELLLGLVTAELLTRPQAAAICTRCANLWSETHGSATSDLFVQKYENIAAALLARPSLPRG